MATNIGIMDSAYFVGRNEILGWINDCLHLSLSRIEEVYRSFVSACVCYQGQISLYFVTCVALSIKRT